MKKQTLKNYPISSDKQSGIGTIEILISLFVMASALTAIMLVIFSNKDIRLDSELANNGLYKALELIDDARAESIHDFNSVVSSASVDELFIETLTVQDSSPCRKDISSKVDWEIGPYERSQFVELNTTFINIEESQSLGGDCDTTGGPISQWWYPMGYYDVDLKFINVGAGQSQSNNAGVGATNIDVIEKNGIKYAVLSTAHSSEKDIWVIDVEGVDPDLGIYPVLVGSLETTSEGLNTIDVFGDTAFTLTKGSSTRPSELQMVDISDPTSLSLIATRSLEISGSCSGNPNYCPNALALYIYSGKVYVGIHRTNGDEFQIFDASSPYNKLGSIEINHNINKIIVRGNYAYFSSSDDTGEAMIIDISDPTILVHPDSSGMKYNIPGNHDGTAIYLLANKLYFARDDGRVSPFEPNFTVLDISNPVNLNSLGSRVVAKNPPNPSAQPLELISMFVTGPFAFIGTDQASFEFQVYRIDDPSNIYNCNEIGQPDYPDNCGLFNFPAKITDLEYNDSFIYASIESNMTFRIIFDNPVCYIDPSDPSCP